MENPRTDSARTHDDSAMIDSIEPAPDDAGSSGGNLQVDIATQAEAARVGEPEASARVQKDDAIEHGTEVRPDRARAPER